MSKRRRRFNADYKFRVWGPSGWEAAKGQQTISELAGQHKPGRPQGANQISQWKRQLLENGAIVFARNGSQDQQEQEMMQPEPYEQIGQLKMEPALRDECPGAASRMTGHTKALRLPSRRAPGFRRLLAKLAHRLLVAAA